VRELLAGGTARLDSQPAAIAGGLIVQTPDGRVSIDCSAEAELARAEDDLRDKILARIVPPAAARASIDNKAQG